MSLEIPLWSLRVLGVPRTQGLPEQFWGGFLRIPFGAPSCLWDSGSPLETLRDPGSLLESLRVPGCT